jgi:hypothetical protein
VVTPPAPLPYDPAALQWNAQHTQNAERKYCYCGKDRAPDAVAFVCTSCRNWVRTQCPVCLFLRIFTAWSLVCASWCIKLIASPQIEFALFMRTRATFSHPVPHHTIRLRLANLSERLVALPAVPPGVRGGRDPPYPGPVLHELQVRVPPLQLARRDCRRDIRNGMYCGWLGCSATLHRAVGMRGLCVCFASHVPVRMSNYSVASKLH